MTINLDLIKSRLFSDTKIRERILRDYDVKDPIANADEFVKAVVLQFDQAPPPSRLNSGCQTMRCSALR
jgi:hypothetical protein